MFTHPYIASQLAQQRRLEFLAEASARPSRGTRRFPRLPRPVLAAGAAAAVIAAVFAAMAAASVPAHAATGRVVAATSTVNDYWEQTNHNINMSSAGGTQAPIMTLNLPAGRWILHADQTMVNFGPSDYAGCTISDPSNPDLNSHGTIVGDPNAAGAWGPASFVASLSETVAVSLSATTTVSVSCDHQNSNGSTPYINSNADSRAHRSSNLVITQLP